MGGGIGGGSSNAATTLVALNELWQTQLDNDELMQLGRQLGADVPIFIHGNSAWAEGIGEQLENINCSENYVLLAIPDCHVSTQKIFSNSALTRDSKITTIAAFLEQGNSNQPSQAFKNDCEALVRKLYPDVDNAINALSKFGHAQMTGTGACAFALFKSEADAALAQQQLPDNLYTVVCKAVNHSPLYSNTL